MFLKFLFLLFRSNSQLDGFFCQYCAMCPTSVLPQSMWAKVLRDADSSILISMRKVSRSMREIVKKNLQDRWSAWCSNAARMAVPSSFTADVGDRLDNKLFREICAGKSTIVLTDLKDFESNWLRLR